MKKNEKQIIKLNNEYVEREYVGDLRLDLDTLRKHVLIVGATGQGKSVILKRFMRSYMARQEKFAAISKERRSKQKMIIHDIKGDFIQEFYTDEDEWIILNPFDKRGYSFEVIELIAFSTDIDRVVNSIIPRPPHEKDPIWTNVSRALLKAIIVLCIERGEFTNADILKYINMGYKRLAYEISTREMYIDDEGKEKARRVPRPGMEEAFAALTSSESQTAIYWSSFDSAMLFFRSFMESNKILNIRDYVREDKRNLILANFSEVQDKIAPILSLFVDCVGSEVLALEENDEYEVILLLDEFNSLEKMPKILEMLKLARSKGGIVVIGIQEMPPIEEKYGKAALSTFKNNTRTKLIFNINDDDTQKMLVSMMGKQVMVYSTESNSGGETETKDGFSTSEQRQTKEAVLDSAIAGLKEHHFFFIQAGISDKKKNYIGKITGMIDPEVDFREKNAKKVIWKDGLELLSIRDHVQKRKGMKFTLPFNDIKQETEIKRIEREEKERKEREFLDELKRKKAERYKLADPVATAAVAAAVAAPTVLAAKEEEKEEEKEVEEDEVEYGHPYGQMGPENDAAAGFEDEPTGSFEDETTEPTGSFEDESEDQLTFEYPNEEPTSEEDDGFEPEEEEDEDEFIL
jgi:DNA segregation ATPase FtsK/SpoIIIE-like protein